MLAGPKLQLGDLLNKVKENAKVQSLLPAYVLRSAQTTLDSVNTLYADSEKAINGDEDIPEGGDDASLKALIAEASVCVTRLKVQLAQAEMFIEGSEKGSC